MSRFIFIFLLIITSLIRVPISFILIIIKKFLKVLRERIEFERRNLLHIESLSFKIDKKCADYCFEVSSEGELEQVRPLIEFYLENHKLIEILFSSPSVESKCIKLANAYSDQLRILRMPLASFSPFSFLFFQSPWSWVTAPVIIFCRYDFFPELLLFKYFGKKMILLSAASKKTNWFKAQSYLCFDLIVAANEKESQIFKNDFPKTKIMAFDFRVPRIFKRLELSQATLNSIAPLNEYLHFLEQLKPHQKLVLGSAWESDFVIFEGADQLDHWSQKLASGEIHLLVVPHSLKSQSVILLKEKLSRMFNKIPVYEISNNKTFSNESLNSVPGIVILNLSGVLCEIYSKFSIAYIGGGYEKSIHSVLEPFLANCKVICGPKVHRSTEFDMIKSIAPSEIDLLNSPDYFYNLFKSKTSDFKNQYPRKQLSIDSEATMDAIIKEIELC